ncbi:D-alanyl-D-alanine carboxypeptidase family protein [Ihubacter sp. rT4E-8]|uniref:D-alanyl-D-alanine carboxypeptidase family protein n=1 Tax=Ihubacter sp. rT4E-8 TaxID=3242369 RepID=UPI003CE74760
MMRKNRKRALCMVCALAICVGGGIMGVKHFSNPQEPVVLETVSDTLTAAGAPSEDEKNANLKLDVKAAVLIDADTGKVIFQQNAHKELPPASVTKVMTMLLAMEAIEDGKVKLTDQVTISERAASMGGSQMYMEVGETHTLEELLQGIAIVSANDGCVATAEYIAGSEEVFVEKMNKRAQELGMRDTHFVNTNGLPVTDHYTSAYDIAVMSRLLLKHKETQKWFNTWQTTIKVGLPGKEKDFGLTNTNKLIKQYPGANGIKTGFTQEAGYCLSASAERDGTTLIAVVLGAKTSPIRNAEVAKLLNYGYANYASVTLAEEGQRVKKITVDKGEPYILHAVTGEKATAFVKKGQEKETSYKANIPKNLKLPLKKGDKIGTLDIYCGDEKLGSCDLVADRNIDKASFFTYYIRKIKNLF